MRTVTRSDTRLSIHPGERFRVELAAMAAGGYTWSLQHVPSNLEKVGEGVRPGGRGIGGSATQTFEFEGVAPGKATLEFRYGRPWESGGDHWKLEVVVE